MLHRENSVNCKFATLNAQIPTEVLLSTAIVNIYDKNNQPHSCRVILDGGSQSSFMMERFLFVLNLPKSNVNIPVVGIHQIQSTIQFAVNAKISSNFFKLLYKFIFFNRSKNYKSGTFSSDRQKTVQNTKISTLS